MSQQLSRDQHAQVVKTAHDILQKDIKSRHTSPGSKTIAFHPDVVKHLVDASTWSKLTDSLKMEALVLCLQAYVVCSPKKKQGMSGLGAISFDYITATQGNIQSSRMAIPENTYQSWRVLKEPVQAFDVVPGTNLPEGNPNLAQTIFCFQHYAEQAAAGVSAQSVVSFQAWPERYEYFKDIPDRNGILSSKDMRRLEYLLTPVNNGFRFVQPGASELALFGKLAASKLIASLNWQGLENALNKLRPYLIGQMSGNPLIGGVSDLQGFARNLSNPVSNLLGGSVNTYFQQLASQLRNEAVASVNRERQARESSDRPQGQNIRTAQQTAIRQSQGPVTSETASQASSQGQSRAQTQTPVNLRAPIDPSRYREQQRR